MNLVKVQYPVNHITADLEKNHIVLVGPDRVNEQVFPADSFGSVGQPLVQAFWSVSPPSTQTIVDRKIMIKHYLEVSVDADLQIGTNDAVRQFPIASILDNINVQINGTTISDNTNDHIHAMMCYGNTPQDRNESLSVSAAQPDSYQQYSDWQIYGSARNPLAEYGENSTEQTRGGMPYIVAADKRSFRIEITEPLFLSPFETGIGSEQEGMVNVNQINVTLRYSSILNKVLSHSSAGNNITAVTVTNYQAPEMLVKFLTPNMTQPIPTVQTLPYSVLQDYIKSVNNFQAGAVQTVFSDTIKLSMIPDRMYVFCRHSKASSDFKTSDSFASIKNIDVTWNNSSGILSSASQQDLYEISSRAGLNQTWPQFSKYRGSVFCAQFGKDIGLGPNEAPQVAGQYTIQVRTQFENLGGTGDYEYYLVMQLGGTISVFENGARASVGNFSQAMVLAATESSPELDHHVYTAIHGGRRGSFWSGFKSFIRKLGSGVASVAKVAAPIVGTLAPELAPIVGSVGMLGSAASKLAGAGRSSGGRLRRTRL